MNLIFKDDYGEIDKNWKDLYEGITKLPNDYFPNEFGKKTYEIRDINNQLIFTEKTAESKELHVHGHFIAKWIGDGFTITHWSRNKWINIV